jgi:N utilization substance protein A
LKARKDHNNQLFLMSATPEQKDQIQQLFRKHVPEVADGHVEILSIAREVGRKCYVAVRSHRTDVDPVGACTGPRGNRLKAMTTELNREYFTVVRWDESPERFITNCFGEVPVSNLALNPVTREAVVSGDSAGMAAHLAASWKAREDLELRLISELTGWRVSLRSDPA